MTIVTVGKTETTREVVNEIEERYADEIRIIRRNARADESDAQMTSGCRSVSMIQYKADKAHTEFLEAAIRARSGAPEEPRS